MRSVMTAMDARTATYAAILTNGQMQYGIGDIDDISSKVTPKVVSTFLIDIFANLSDML